MEAAVDQHLAEAGAQQGLGQPGPVKAEGVDPLDLADADPVQPLHDQDPGGGQLGVDDRHVHPVVVGEGGDVAGVAGLEPEVELLAQPVGELLRQVGHVVVGAPGGAGLGHPGQLGHHPGREQVGAGRQDLAELDEHAAALLEGLAPAGAAGDAAAFSPTGRPRPSSGPKPYLTAIPVR